MNLTDHLNACAELWAEASGKSVARLSTIVVNDGKFFARLGTGKLGIHTATLEKFADFFADAGAWDEGRIPAEVGEFIHRVAGITPDAALSPDGEAPDIGPEIGPDHDYDESEPRTGGQDPAGGDSSSGAGHVTPDGAPGELFAFSHDVLDAPALCPECDLRTDDVRVAQCVLQRCPRRIAA